MRLLLLLVLLSPALTDQTFTGFVSMLAFTNRHSAAFTAAVSRASVCSRVLVVSAAVVVLNTIAHRCPG